jgi:uncharacterized protein (TIGR03085 family)
LDELGPQAPTLLNPWTTPDLAAHLTLREHDPLAAPGLGVPGAWGRFAEQRRLALKEAGFTDLVATVRSGPPPGFFRTGLVRRFPNLNEFFVHHEDVRGADGFGPRTGSPRTPRSFAMSPGRAGSYRDGCAAPGLALECAGRDKVISARQGQPTARLTGLPGELLLFLFGRRDAADVEITDPLRTSKPYSRHPSGCDAQPKPYGGRDRRGAVLDISPLTEPAGGGARCPNPRPTTPRPTCYRSPGWRRLSWPHRRSPSAIPRWTSRAFEVVGLEGRRRSPWPFGPAGMDSTTMRGLLAALRDGSSSSLMGAGSPAGPLRRPWWVDLSLSGRRREEG